MSGPAPDHANHPVETITLSCGHRLTPHTVARPLVWPGSVTRCSTCTVPRTILRVELPTPRHRSPAQDSHLRRRERLLIRLDRLDLPLPVEIETRREADNAAALDPRTRQALIKLLGHAIDLVGETETRALAPALVAYLAGGTA